MQKNITKKKLKSNKSLLRRAAIFLDRDGTLIDSPDLNWKKKQFKLSREVSKEIKYFNDRNVPIIVVTNQPVVARGWISEEGVVELHEMLNKRLRKKNARIDRFYFCPHHPNANDPKYRKICECRKPSIGLFKKACKEFYIDPQKSFVVGDMTQDIFAGKKLKAITVLVEQGYGGKDGKFKITPDYIAPSTAQALRYIKKRLKL